ncbi:prepilin peptidase [Micromonospora pallida]|uniref:prepilin peptidase n=1 Tax=Micromonospora pallida TaxID=145854 RepID=UPI00159F1D3F|nr:prepilin peptidase [Micromonospora pallida]
MLLPTVGYRLAVPYGEPSRTTCATCGVPLRSGTAGWLARRCDRGHRLGVPWWVTASLAALAGALLGAALGAVAVLPVFLALAVLGVLLAVIDVACHRLPDSLALPALTVTPVLLGVVALTTGQWADWRRGLLGCLAVGLVLTGLVLLPGGGFGFGDAKVGALLGWYLGWLSWDTVILGLVLPWALNVPVLLALLAARRVRWRTKLPFGPALLGGALLSVLVTTG